MKIYYAHCMAIYDTKQEERDIDILLKMFANLGADIFNPNNEIHKLHAKQDGMKYFEDIVKTCDILAFRALPNGKIPAGVWTEIQIAKEHGLPVIELPCYTGREMSVEETRSFLSEIGQR